MIIGLHVKFKGKMESARPGTGNGRPLTLSAYIYLVLLVFNLMNAVLTLPGIAALILGVGMAVDANILTAERIKEELRAGKSVMSAFKAGSKRAFTTILAPQRLAHKRACGVFELLQHMIIVVI